MSVHAGSVDYYATLQVHPDADFEVIEAAYRQLMKKHHPDMAGDDPARIAEHLERSKAINQAFSVLRDPERRRRYDLDRMLMGTVPPPTSPPRSSAHSRASGWSASTAGAQSPNGASSSAGDHFSAASTPEETSTSPTDDASDSRVTYVEPQSQSWLRAPFTLISAAYYLLPGPYEWERGRTRELLTVVLLPPTGLAAFLLASGRLAPLLGHSLSATVVAWGVLGVCAALLMWGSVLRVVVAGAPTAGMLSGPLTPVVQGSHIPVWLAWCLLSSLSLFFAARLFVFGVLPTVALIWVLNATH